MLLRELFEAKINEVAIIFGRFNPPHKGHKAAWEMAAESPIWYVGTNKNTVGPKDPLPFDIKVKAMTAIWPGVAKNIIAETSWLTLASKVYENHGDVTLYVLTDEDWVTKTLLQYNGKEGSHGLYKFSKIEQRLTPRLSSATALRDAVVNSDRDAFANAAGVSADLKVAGKLFFDLVAEYLLPYTREPKKTKKIKDSLTSTSDGSINEDLRKWFKQKWVRFGPDGKIRGDCARGSEKEGKPKCLPQAKAHALGKKGRSKSASRKRRKDPDANRSGKAINVKTE